MLRSPANQSSKNHKISQSSGCMMPIAALHYSAATNASHQCVLAAKLRASPVSQTAYTGALKSHTLLALGAPLATTSCRAGGLWGALYVQGLLPVRHQPPSNNQPISMLQAETPHKTPHPYPTTVPNDVLYTL